MTTLLFLRAGEPRYRWWRIADARVAEAGEGVPPVDDGSTILIPPAAAVTLHWADLPARSAAQAQAAARLLVADASAAPAAELHVAVGAEEEDDRPIAVTSAAAMAEWLVELASIGIDPVAIVPAPLLLPRPSSGFVQGELAGETLIRGRTVALADEPVLTELVTAGERPTVLDAEEVEAAAVAAAARPPLDLRQGPFARRRPRAIDWPLVRRLALLGLAILLVTLAIDLVRIVRYDLAADALDARADTLARTGLAPGETVTDADRQLTERLSRVRGPGLGYTATLATVYEAVRAVPGTELTALDFQANGDLRLGVACEREALATDLRRAMEARGLLVQPSVFQAAGGQVAGEFAVRVP